MKMRLKMKMRFRYCAFLLLIISCDISNNSGDDDSGDLKKSKDTLSSTIEKSNDTVIQYYENGEIKCIGRIVDGNKLGVWKYYDENNVLNKAVQHTSDTVSYELDVNDFAFSTFHFHNEKGSIKIPENWQTKLQPDNTISIILSSRKECDSTSMFCSTFSVTLENNLEFPLAKLAEEEFKLFIEKFPKYKIVDDGKININGLEGFQKVYIFSVNGLDLGGITTWIRTEKYIFILTGIAPNLNQREFIKYLGALQEITNSFNYK